MTVDQERFLTESESVAELQSQALEIAQQRQVELQEKLKETEGILKQERKGKTLMETSFREQYVSTL